SWGRNLRMALATVLVFWTFVEVAARNGFFNEIWVDPLNHITEMVIILAVFLALVVGYWLYNDNPSTGSGQAQNDNDNINKQLKNNKVI
ncbi:MAG: hypothetical protein MJZ36_11575, partial [Bacteroidaceae bacterium]|nr:hypothetical protein [Bacteroidaceae bacterium]